MKQTARCVKVAQRVLPDGSYFPYDRVYLIPKSEAKTMSRVFRYYMSMPLTEHIVEMLNGIKVSRECRLTIERDDAQLSGVSPDDPQDRFDDIDNPSDWVMVVPTSVRTKFKKGVGPTGDVSKPVASALRYVMSQAVYTDKNKQVQLPQIHLHTPTRTVKFLCGVCQHLPDFHAGKCSPGQRTCRQQARVTLPYDDHFKLSEESK